MSDLTGWRTSSYSGGGNNCVEVAFGDQIVGIRDTKDRASGHIELPGSAWLALLDAVQSGQLPQA